MLMVGYGESPLRWLRQILVALALALVFSGCGSGEVSHPYREEIRQALSDVKDEWTRGVLERALITGTIERADYLEDIDREVNCLKDNGLTAHTKEDVLTGRVQIEIESDAAESAVAQMRETMQQCSLKAGIVSGFYEQMQSNPQNAPDTSDSDAITCFKQQGLVPETFTEADYNRLGELNAQDLRDGKLVDPHYPDGFTMTQKLAWDKCVEEASFRPKK